jgi:hypothetical protein
MRCLEIVALVAVLAGLGCEYGPQQLPALRTHRDLFQKLVNDIEVKHGIPTSGPSCAEVERQLAQAAQEIESLETELAAERDAWFQSLTPEQKFQWALHRDQMQFQREWLMAERQVLLGSSVPVPAPRRP